MEIQGKSLLIYGLITLSQTLSRLVREARLAIKLRQEEVNLELKA
jgi:hypothetical protein